MDILLIGGASTFLQSLTDKLYKEGHRVFWLTADKRKSRRLHKIFETYTFPYEDGCIREVFESIKPDRVVFSGAYDTGFSWKDTENTAVSYTSGLMNILMAFSAQQKGRFIYISSEEVFQKKYTHEIDEEEAFSAYNAKGQSVAMGEEMCRNYQKMTGMDFVMLRLDHMYGIPHDRDDMDSVCAGMCMEAIETGEIVADPAQKISLLHVSDAVEFLYRVMIEKEHASNLYHIAGENQLTVMEAATLIQNALGGVDTVKIVEDHKKNAECARLSNRRFAEEFGIRIVHTASRALPELALYLKRHMAQFTRKEESRKRDLRQRMKEIAAALLPFAENVICFIPFFMLNNRAVGSPYFANLDFYLLYVLLFAIVYGQQQAIFSSLLAMAGYCFRQMYQRSGFDVMLDYNTYIWIAQLLILGLAVGYMRDQLRNVRDEQEHEIAYLSGQLSDIEDINVSNVRVKEILSNQLINQNDSFGKIYEITSSLDKYEPEEVIFYAAEVLSKLMGSKDVAIYMVANRSYARLFSATSSKARCLGNSIHYQQMGPLYEAISKRKVYINKDMDEQYPLMANAIYSEDEMQLILMVWGIPWERMTLGQANLLTIIGYLIQNAVVRASRYMEALEQQRYIAGTRLLEADAFTTLVRAYLNARDRNLTECTLLLVEPGKAMDDRAVSDTLSPMVRQTDYLGKLKDGQLHALLSNTNAKDAEYVRKRFQEKGFFCEVEEEAVL